MAYIKQGITSFLRFLDDFFDDSPSYNFVELARHIPMLLSTRRDQAHIKFHFSQAREFERHFPVTYDVLQSAGGSHYWRAGSNYGLMEPCPREEYDRPDTNFPPILITRNHSAVWFDADPDGNWKTGEEARDWLTRKKHV